MANHTPTYANRRNDADDVPQPMRAEAIAMRRIIVEMGYYLSPFQRDTPLPVLTEFERTADLSKLDRQSSAASKGRQRIDQSKSVLERVDRGSRDNARNFEPRTVVEVTLQRTKSEHSKTTLKARKAHRAEVVQRAKAEGRSPAEVDRELAVARIAAVAAEKAAAVRKVSVDEREARRRETANAANARYVARLEADPVRAAARAAARKASNERRNVKDRQDRAAAREARQGGGAPRPMPNPHRDPTLPTARQLREEAAAAAAIEAEEARLLALFEKEGRRATRERNLHPPKSRGTQRDDR